jgi:hypothetical protein
MDLAHGAPNGCHHIVSENLIPGCHWKPYRREVRSQAPSTPACAGTFVAGPALGAARHSRSVLLGTRRCAHFNPLLDNPYQPAKAGPTALLIERNVRCSDQGRVDGDFSSHQRVEIGRLHIHRVNTKLSQFILQAGAR